MRLLTRWFAQAPILRADAPNGPWGDKDANDGGKAGPRNPWAAPPKTPKPSALDEFLKRARGSGDGGGGGGGSLIPRPPHPRALWSIGAGLLVALWLIGTSFHAIGPQQRGVVTYFGRYAFTLDPGLQWTLPAPIASVQRVDVQAIHSDDLPAEGGERPMLTSDKNLIDLTYSVRWDIANPEDYAFQIKDPEPTVKAVAESAMREEIANVTLDQALTTGQVGIETRVQARMQRLLDGYRSGVRIRQVAIKQAVPPEKVNEAFKRVTSALSSVVTLRNNAEKYAQQVLARAQGDAAAFDAYYIQYKLSPEVTRRRMYYETMELVLAHADKTIVETPGVAPLLPLGRARVLPDPAQPQAGAAQ